ncbi:c-type cytochrome [Undibacterium sp. SXout11W]|uniref:c-type cytochrome n=1 Tax=Undibacterium sp. SXout11W TaxID=3413050 RepID=UPI003BF2ADD1
MMKKSKRSAAIYRVALTLYCVGSTIAVDVFAAGAMSANPNANVRAGRSGATVFTLMCAECHITGISGAPKMSDKAAWTARLKQSPDTLLEHALHGYKMMPARGSCSSCSDTEIKAAVEYMLEKVR